MYLIVKKRIDISILMFLVLLYLIDFSFSHLCILNLAADTSCLHTLAGVGKSSLVHLLIKGSPITRPSQTIGCTVGVKVKTPHFLASPQNASLCCN